MRESAVKAAADRKAEFETMASFHHTPEETEMEKENRLRDHHLIERANELTMEQLQDIKKLYFVISNLTLMTLLPSEIVWQRT